LSCRMPTARRCAVMATLSIGEATSASP
jgi:hypothetical protein